MAFPSVFSEDQIVSFLKYIGLSSLLQQQRFSDNASQDLHFLQQLHTHTIVAIP